MNKRSKHSNGLLIFFLAMICASGTLLAEEGPSTGKLANLDRKQASAQAIAQGPPSYPPIARINYIQGRVLLEITVDPHGNVDSSHVLQGNAMLAEAALEASRRWIYYPLQTPGGPAGFRTTVSLKFQLQSTTDPNGFVELTPEQAERDFLRQVKPPQITKPPEDVPAQDALRLRLLLNEQGQIVDVDAPANARGQLDSASEVLHTWTFQPARWGNLPVASYINVDVPLASPALAQAGVNSRGR